MKKTDGPCPDCGWKFGTNHICVNLSRPCPGEGVLEAPKIKRPMPQEQRDKIAEAQRRRHATFRGIR